MKDEEAVRRVRDGDRDAYRILVDRYAALVFSVVRRYCRDPSESEDLAQDVFIRAYEALDGFEGNARFSSWLYRIAVNRCRDWTRDPRRSERSLDEMAEARGYGPGDVGGADADVVGANPAAAGGLASVSPTPAEELEIAERARRLRWALGELAPDYAVPLLMKYEENMTYQEMAKVLDATAGALKVRVHRARSKLRSLLEERP